MAFSPQGTRLASAGDEHSRIWDVALGLEMLTLSGDHNSIVVTAAFSPMELAWPRAVWIGP